MGILLKNKEERYNYLRNIDISSKKETKMSSVYFLVKYGKEGFIEPIYFTSYEGHFFESPCVLNSYNLNESELEEYVHDTYVKEAWEEALIYEKTMMRENIHYEIDCPQTNLFLPNEIEIIDILSESECVDWLLTHN